MKELKVKSKKENNRGAYSTLSSMDEFNDQN